MSLAGWLRRLQRKEPAIRLRILIKGRIGDGWYDVDRTLEVAPGTTLSGLLDAADEVAVPLRQALDESPHLRDTLMLNGERCPLAENSERLMEDGDELYLLAPIAGGRRPDDREHPVEANRVPERPMRSSPDATRLLPPRRRQR